MSTATHHGADDHGAARRLGGAMRAAAAAQIVGRAALARHALDTGDAALFARLVSGVSHDHHAATAMRSGTTDHGDDHR
jgi:hypothetical protein